MRKHGDITAADRYNLFTFVASLRVTFGFGSTLANTKLNSCRPVSAYVRTVNTNCKKGNDQ